MKRGSFDRTALVERVVSIAIMNILSTGRILLFAFLKHVFIFSFFFLFKNRFIQVSVKYGAGQ